MYALNNPELTVLVLDPIADATRLGSRYCTGGYIWQVLDAHQGELLTGPEYPQAPNTFDGQGAPDMFQTALGAEGVPMGGEVGCIGVGRVRRTSEREPFDVRYNREVIEFVKWDVECTREVIIMCTEHTYRDWAYRLERVVALNKRTIFSSTKIHCLGTAPLPVRWFAHPFFPISRNDVLCQFTPPISMPENPGYFLNAEGFVARKPEHDWKRGYYQALDFDKLGKFLSVTQKHPKVGEVSVVTTFSPTFLPIWGNDRTFSFEPYFERLFNPGEHASWSIEYRFGSGNLSTPPSQLSPHR